MVVPVTDNEKQAAQSASASQEVAPATGSVPDLRPRTVRRFREDRTVRNDAHLEFRTVRGFDVGADRIFDRLHRQEGDGGIIDDLADPQGGGYCVAADFRGAGGKGCYRGI